VRLSKLGVLEAFSRGADFHADRAKTQPSFHTAFFCSLFRALRASRIEKFAKNFDLRNGLQISAEFSHGLQELCTVRDRLEN
jgi:hypothetical protein